MFSSYILLTFSNIGPDKVQTETYSGLILSFEILRDVIAVKYFIFVYFEIFYLCLHFCVVGF